MRKILLSIICVFLFFLCEFIIFNLVGRIFVPNLLLLLTIFFTLAFGIRYGLLTAILVGLLKDSFNNYIFGVDLFTFVICVFATILLRKHIYQTGSKSSRLLLVFIVIIIEEIARLMVHWMFGPVDLLQVFLFILIPEIITTLIVATYVFENLRKCVLRLFVL